MKLDDILFSVHEYDKDGDIYDEGIYLHFGPDLRVKVADNVKDFELVADRIKDMIEEIRENYSGVNDYAKTV